MSKDLPKLFKKLEDNFPRVYKKYEELGATCHEAGPLSLENRRLVKLALAIAIGSEGAVHSHVRRALAEGIARDKIIHTAILSIPTIGLPKAQAGLSWIYDILD